MKGSLLAKIKILVSMFLFATLVIPLRHLSQPSCVIALFRAFIGAGFLWLLMTIMKKKLDFQAIRRNILLLLAGGALIAFQWIFLFEAYFHTTVAAASLSFNMAPILVILFSPLFFRERLTKRKLICAAAAFIGLFFLSGVLYSGELRISGMLYGFCGAIMYALITICNKKLHDIDSYTRTVFQLFFSGVVLLPYCFLTQDMAGITYTGTELLILLLLGTVFTGVTYVLYFGGLPLVKAQTASVFCYIDPVTSFFIGAWLLHESTHVLDYVGAVLIIGAAIVSELEFKRPAPPSPESQPPEPPMPDGPDAPPPPPMQ